MEDLSAEPPTDINPYEVLQLEPTASPNDVKTAYKKLALTHHPDKVSEDERDIAHTKFQEIAFAYAILSDPRRRQRYDSTGNTSESIDVEDGFDWADFYKAQFADAVTGQKLNDFKESYQYSEEEERDVLAAYRAAKGDMNKVFSQVMLSSPLHDETRFRQMIEKAISAGDEETFKSFTEEPESKRLKRQRREAQESSEAMEYAKELGVYDALFSTKTANGHSDKNGHKKSRLTQKGQGVQDEAALAGLIQKNQMAKAEGFLEKLEAKYVVNGKKRKHEEPPEELFQNNRQKLEKRPEPEVEENPDEDGDEEFDEDEEEAEEEEVKPKSTASRGRKRGKITPAQKADPQKTSSKKAATKRGLAKKAST